jgi:hypothetical protein
MHIMPPPWGDGHCHKSHLGLAIPHAAHEFSARTSLSEIAAVTGETAGAEDRTREANLKLISIFLRFYGI